MSGSELFLYTLLAMVVVMYSRRLYLQWKVRHVTAEELAERLASRQEIIILDVRTVAERRERSIDGSIHIPLHELKSRMDELHRHRDKEIVVYCRSGNRSLSAAAKLAKNGYSVSNLKGGMTEWNFRNLR